MKLQNILLTSLLAVSFAALSTSALAASGKKLADPEFAGSNTSNRLEFTSFTRVYAPVNYEVKAGVGVSGFDFGSNAEFNVVFNGLTFPNYRSELVYGFGGLAEFSAGSFTFLDDKYTANAISGLATGLVGFKTVASESFDVASYLQIGLGFYNISNSATSDEYVYSYSKAGSGFDFSLSSYVGLIYNQTYSLGLKYSLSEVSTYLVQFGYQF